MDAIEAKVNRELIKYAVMRAIFCPYTGHVLDTSRAVLVRVNGGASFIMTADWWDARQANVLLGIEEAKNAGAIPADTQVEVLDGRKYYTPSGRARAASSI